MDDTLEIPRPSTETGQDDDEQSSADEDGGLDWTRLPKLGTAARPVIPKRGEKDFEPASGGESGLQLHFLDRSRDAMVEALRANRTISSKNTSYGLWYPSIDRVHVTSARGIHFSAMGHFISRTVDSDLSQGSSSKLSKRLELLPEEALYLIERGALFCYKSLSSRTSSVDPLNYETQSPGAPMSVQQAFAEMIGREDLTLERYQVYAYLKRLGYILIRAEPPTPEYPVASVVSTKPRSQTWGLKELFTYLVSKITKVIYGTDYWRGPRFHRPKTAQNIFKALRFIPCGHTIPLYHPPIKAKLSTEPSARSLYKIFFHVYKPSTPFRKTAPPAPDFYVVVVDARTTAVPSLQELTALFGILPEMPLPPPRKRGVSAPTKQSGTPRATPPVPPKGPLPAPTPRRFSTVWTFFYRLLSFLPFFPLPQSTEVTFRPPRPNPFLALKTGKKIVVIAAVDASSISFFRFGQGVFEEWPMV